MQQVDFSKGKILNNIISTAVPMLLAQLINLLYSIVDRVYIGRIEGIGVAALGGVGLCFPIISVIGAFTYLYAGGGAPLFAMERGKKNADEASLVMSVTFTLEILTSIIIIAAGLLFGQNILRVFGASEAAMAYALPYLRIYLLGTVFAMVSTGMNPFINAQGYPRISMAAVVTGALCNIALDPVFIFLFHWGVKGAATATVISQAVSAYITFSFLRSGRAEERLFFVVPSVLTRHLKLIGNIIGLGSASFIMMVTNSLVQISCNRVLADLGGDIYVSVMTIISSVRQILEVPLAAITDGAAPVISYNYGAGRPTNVKKAVRLMSVMAISYTLLTWLTVVLFPSFFIGIFSSDRELFSVAGPALHIYFFAFVFMALQYCGQTTFKALNRKGHAIFFSIFRKAMIVVPLTYLLSYGFRLGTDGVFIAEPVSNVIGGTACFVTMCCTVYRRLSADR
jgi:putative MATE family efflux protein